MPVIRMNNRAKRLKTSENISKKVVEHKEERESKKAEILEIVLDDSTDEDEAISDEELGDETLDIAIKSELEKHLNAQKFNNTSIHDTNMMTSFEKSVKVELNKRIAAIQRQVDDKFKEYVTIIAQQKVNISKLELQCQTLESNMTEIVDKNKVLEEKLAGEKNATSEVLEEIRQGSGKLSSNKKMKIALNKVDMLENKLEAEINENAELRKNLSKAEDISMDLKNKIENFNREMLIKTDKALLTFPHNYSIIYRLVQ